MIVETHENAKQALKDFEYFFNLVNFWGIVPIFCSLVAQMIDVDFLCCQDFKCGHLLYLISPFQMTRRTKCSPRRKVSTRTGARTAWWRLPTFLSSQKRRTKCEKFWKRTKGTIYPLHKLIIFNFIVFDLGN